MPEEDVEGDERGGEKAGGGPAGRVRGPASPCQPSSPPPHPALAAQAGRAASPG